MRKLNRAGSDGTSSGVLATRLPHLLKAGDIMLVNEDAVNEDVANGNDVNKDSSLDELSQEDLQKALDSAKEELASLKRSGELNKMKSELECLRKEIASLKEQRVKEKNEALNGALTHSAGEVAQDSFESSLISIASGRFRKGVEKNGN